MALNRKAVKTNVHRALRTSFVNLNANVALISDGGSISGGKKVYKNIIDVETDFAKTTEFYKMAKAYFAKGAETLWAVVLTQSNIAATSGFAITKDIAASDLTALKAITDGEFNITIDGTAKDVKTIDLSTVTDLTSLAIILDGKLAKADVTVEGSALKITSKTTGVASEVNSITSLSTAVGTDISTYLSTVTTQVGSDQASSFDVIKRITELENESTPGFNFISVTMDKAINGSTQILNGSLAKFIFDKDYVVAIEVTGPDPLAGTSSVIRNNRDFYKNLSGLDRLKNGNLIALYTDKPDDYVATGYMGAMLAEDIGLTTPKFVKPTESSPVTLTGSELQYLLSDNVNVYTGTNERVGRAFIKEGTSLMDNVFVDTLLGGIWVKVQLENAIYDLLETKKVPMNNNGFTLLESMVLPVFQKAANQGIINGQAGGQTTFPGDNEPTNIFGYAIKFRAGDVANREVVGQFCYYDNIATHFVTNEVCIKLIEDGK